MEMILPSQERTEAAQNQGPGATNGATSDPDNFPLPRGAVMTGVLKDARPDSRPSWPFHRHTSSEVPSTPLTTLFRFNWPPKSLFRPADDTASISSRSLVPDYVVHYMRGETPETLARRRERMTWGERAVEITPRRDTFYSRAVDIEDPSASTTHLNPVFNAYGNEGRQRGFQSWMSGWRGGISWNILLSMVMLLTGVVCFILAAVATHSVNGETAIYSGSCSTASSVNIALHVLIGIFCVIQLAGSNYLIQVLSSPTRMEVAKAHSQKRWLDIGISSLRNFGYVSRFRSLLAAVVLVTAVVTQVIHNALIVTINHAPLNSNHSGTGMEVCDTVVSHEMLLAVAILDLVMALCLASAQAQKNFEPLVTLGDAIRSFLRMPDPTTIGAYPLSKADASKAQWAANEAKQQPAGASHWFSTASLRRWALALVSWLAVLGPVTAACGLVVSEGHQPQAGSFGTGTGYAAVQFSTHMTPTQTAIVAALPQLLLAVLYLAVNALLTTFFVSHELSLFAISPQPLRVSSDPVGAQITSLYLTLPRPVSWLLLVVFAAMSLVLSQAVSPLAFTDGEQATGISFSPLALLILLILTIALAVLVAVFALRRVLTTELGNGETGTRANHLVLHGGTCSAVISSLCQSSAESHDIWRKRMIWCQAHSSARSHGLGYGFEAVGPKAG